MTEETKDIGYSDVIKAGWKWLKRKTSELGKSIKDKAKEELERK